MKKKITALMLITVFAFCFLFGCTQINVDLTIQPTPRFPASICGIYLSEDGDSLEIDPDGFWYRRSETKTAPGLGGVSSGPMEKTSENTYQDYDFKNDIVTKLVFTSETTVEFYVDDRLINTFQKNLR